MDQRSRIGDWEIVTIMGGQHQGALLFLVESKSRLCVIGRLPNKSAQEVERTTINLLDSVKAKVHTFTSDIGKVFDKHESIAKSLDAQFFFAHPYASWERGLNENTIWAHQTILPEKKSIQPYLGSANPVGDEKTQ